MPPASRILFAAAFLATPVGAHATCVQEASPVTVEARFHGHTLDHSKPRTSIARMLDRAPFAGFAAQGLTAVEFTGEYRMAIVLSEYARGQWCATVERIDASFGLAKPAKVLIASEIRKGSCDWKAVYEHELDHVAVAEGNVRRASPEIAEGIRNVLRTEFPVRASSRDQAERAARGAVDRVFTALTDRAIARAQTENDALDTRDSYLALGAHCRR